MQKVVPRNVNKPAKNNFLGQSHLEHNGLQEKNNHYHVASIIFTQYDRKCPASYIYLRELLSPTAERFFNCGLIPNRLGVFVFH